MTCLFLSLDDSCPFCQHNDINEIGKHLNLFFSNACDWLVGNKLSIHFGEDKRKSILFVSKLKSNNILKTDIKYRDRTTCQQCLEKQFHLMWYIKLTTS